MVASQSYELSELLIILSSGMDFIVLSFWGNGDIPF